MAGNLTWQDFTPAYTGRMIHSFINPEEPFQEAQREAQRGWGEAKGFEMPFMQQGQEQYGPLNQARQELMNPADLFNKWASTYETSPYAKRELEQNQQAGLEAASSMGLMGSSGALNNIQKGAGDIVSSDRQKYLDDLMDKYMKGIGLGSSLYGTGANMGGLLGQQAQQQGVNMGNLKYGESRAPSQLFENLIRLLASSQGAGIGS